MGRLKISLEQQKALRESTKKELLRLETALKDKETIELLDAFKNKYNLCETIYKIILAEHQKKKNKSVDGYLKVHMTQVPYALQFAGYTYDRGLLSKIFSADKSSVKKLRDAVTHSFDERAVEEIKTRKNELFAYMDEFLMVIKNADVEEK